jgi:hypothetical protein
MSRPEVARVVVRDAGRFDDEGLPRPLRPDGVSITS